MPPSLRDGGGGTRTPRVVNLPHFEGIEWDHARTDQIRRGPQERILWCRRDWESQGLGR